MKTNSSIFIFVAQILGAIAAAGVVRGLIPGGVLYNVVLDPNTSVAQGLFLEMFLTAELVFTILMLAAEVCYPLLRFDGVSDNIHRNKSLLLLPPLVGLRITMIQDISVDQYIGIGLALFVAELVGVYWTGGALNPARAFGPCVVQGSFPGYHWLYCKTNFKFICIVLILPRARTRPRRSPRFRLLWSLKIFEL